MKRAVLPFVVFAALGWILFQVVPQASTSSARGAAGGDDPQRSTSGPQPSFAVVQHDQLKPADLPQDLASEVLLPVPAYLWRHGCGPTALGMVVGYYDAQGFSDLVPGPASSQTGPVNQVIASGGDKGNPYPPGSEQHFEDYATPLDDTTPTMLTDDALAKGRTPHASNSLADFMQTSFSERDNRYGWSWSNDMGPAWTGYVQLANPSYTANYQEYRYVYGEMTWAVLTAEIDAGHPMVILVDSDGNGSTDHFVPVIGYRTSPSQQYASWDTWSNDTVRWENFRGMAVGAPWGMWGGWSFQLTGAVPPGEFGKLSPANGSTNQPTSLSLDWQDSPGAASYEYCLDTSNDGACASNWVSTGHTSSASLKGLSFKTTYYWQARAVNPNGATYADGNEADTWSFTTQSPIKLLSVWTADGNWNKKTSFKPGEPIQWVITVENLFSSSLSIDLTYDARNPNGVQVVSWKGSMTADPGITDFGLSGTAPSGVMGAYTFTGYVGYLGENSQGTSTVHVSLVDPPGTFYKLSPVDGITVYDSSLSLDWTDSLNAAAYEYCYDTTDDGACSQWIGTGANSNVDLSGLHSGYSYYWQVRATNEGGVAYGNGSETNYWTFTPRVQELLFVPLVSK
jgi:hypothetical protein